MSQTLYIWSLSIAMTQSLVINVQLPKVGGLFGVVSNLF